jgi:nucleotide-binding universal stress UspA family protein
MTGRIVVGIDGSQQSGNALEWAVERARLGGEQLELLNAYTLVPELNVYGFSGAPSQPVDWYVDFSGQLLEAAATRVRELAPALTCKLTSQLGHPAYLLAEASEAADAVVVGRRGLGSVASTLMGSVSNRLTSQAKCPLVVVGEEKRPTTGPIVVGIDGSEFGVRALRYALAEAAVHQTAVRAVAAYELLHPALRDDPELVARMQADVERETADTIAHALDEVKDTDTASVSVEPVAVQGPAAEAILDHAKDARLIVVGTHGKGLVRRILLGSVSRRVLNDADRPVAVVDVPEA